MDSNLVIQVIAINLNGLATGMMLGTGAYRRHGWLFALNGVFLVWNSARVLGGGV